MSYDAVPHTCQVSGIDNNLHHSSRLYRWLMILPIACALLPIAPPTADATQILTRWIAGEDGDWTNPDNWDNGVPSNGGGNTYVAIIDDPIGYIINLNYEVTVEQCLMTAYNATLNIIPGAKLRIEGPDPRFELSAGVLSNNGIVECNGGTFRFEQADAVLGDVILHSCRLEAPGGGGGAPVGPASFEFRGYCTMAGDIHEGWSATIMGVTPDGGATLVPDGSLANYGDLILNSSEGWDSELEGTTLFNQMSGTVLVLAGDGGARKIYGSVENQGSMTFNADTEFPTASASHSLSPGSGPFQIVTNRTLRILGAGADFTVSSGAALDIDGLLELSGGGTLMISSAEDISGSVILRSSRLEAPFGGGGPPVGPASFEMRGSCTMSGEIHDGWSVTIQGITPDGNGLLTPDGSLTNHGGLTLTSSDGWDSELAGAGLFNMMSGTVLVLPGDGGARRIYGSVENQGSVTLNADTEFPTVGASHALSPGSGPFQIVTNRTLNVSGTDSEFSVHSPATLDIDGLMEINSGGTLRIDNSEDVSGNVVIRHGRLELPSGGGGPPANPATFSLWGSSTISGTIQDGWTLEILAGSPYGAGELTPDTALNNYGVIRMDSTDELDVVIHSTILVNEISGIIDVNPGAGGARTIHGSFSNRGQMNIGADTEFPTSASSNAVEAGGVLQVGAARTMLMSGSGAELAVFGGGLLDSEGLLDLMDNGMLRIDDAADITGNVALRNSRLEAPAGGGPAVGPATFTFNGSCSMSGDVHEGWNVLINAGSPYGNATVTMDSGLTNYGSILLSPGESGELATLSPGPGMITNNPSGILGGTGTIDGEVSNAGSVAPGSSAGLLEVTGPLTFHPGASLDIELGGLIAGEQYDKVQCDAELTLDGTLNISVIDGFLATTGDMFEIALANPCTGVFSAIEGAYAPNDRFFEVFYSESTVILRAHELAPADVEEDESADGDEGNSEEEDQEELPAALRLFSRLQAGGSVLCLELPESGETVLEVFDLSGRRVALLADDDYAAGVYAFSLDGLGDRADVWASGVYFARAIVTTSEVRCVRTTRIPILK